MFIRWITDNNFKPGWIIERYYLQKTRPYEIILSFRVKLMVFMALTTCFRKNFMNFSFFILFVAQWLSVPIKDPVSFHELWMNLDSSVSCYLMYVLYLNIFVFWNNWWFFYFCIYFFLFFSTSGAFSVKSGWEQISWVKN